MTTAHPYIRAYMAGASLPTVFLLFVFAAFCVARFGYNVDFPIERGLVFPLALVPNLWGLWNVLQVAIRPRRWLPLGLHGALLPLVLTPSAFGVATLLRFEIPSFLPTAAALFLPLAMIVYYLVWKYAVRFLNDLVEVA